MFLLRLLIPIVRGLVLVIAVCAAILVACAVELWHRDRIPS